MINLIRIEIITANRNTLGGHSYKLP
jgi:hypothetical protein